MIFGAFQDGIAEFSQVKNEISGFLVNKIFVRLLARMEVQNDLNIIKHQFVEFPGQLPDRNACSEKFRQRSRI